MNRFATVTAMLVMLLVACKNNLPVIPENDLLVVRAYLYAGEPVADIQITGTFGLSADTTAGLPINDASVTLEKNSITFPLVLSPGDSGYYHYPGDDLSVNVGDEFHLTAERNGTVVTATTIIPSPPTEVTISSDEMLIESFEFGNGRPPFGGFGQDTAAISVSWQNESEDFHFIIVKNVEDELEPISDFPGFFGAFRSFRSAPIREDEYQVTRLDLTYWGVHEVRVYRVNQEYADLYAFGLQDSRNLNEPNSNIENGLGVFAGFSSKVVRFTVKEATQ
jgi:hypothetical protein